MGALVVALLWSSVSSARLRLTETRAASCASSLRQLSLALAAYAADYDGQLPTSRDSNELAGVDYWMLAQEARKPEPNVKAALNGPLLPYTHNNGILFCPADPWKKALGDRTIADRFPKPGISYVWNAAVAAKPLSDLPADTWLLRDREPWHAGRRIATLADGSTRADSR